MNVLACGGDCWGGVGWAAVKDVFGVCWAGDVVCWIRTEGESKIFELVPTLETKVLIEEYICRAAVLNDWHIRNNYDRITRLWNKRCRSIDLWKGKSWGNGNLDSLNCTCLVM